MKPARLALGIFVLSAAAPALAAPLPLARVQLSLKEAKLPLRLRAWAQEVGQSIDGMSIPITDKVKLRDAVVSTKLDELAGRKASVRIETGGRLVLERDAPIVLDKQKITVSVEGLTLPGLLIAPFMPRTYLAARRALKDKALVLARSPAHTAIVIDPARSEVKTQLSELPEEVFGSRRVTTEVRPLPNGYILRTRRALDAGGKETVEHAVHGRGGKREFGVPDKDVIEDARGLTILSPSGRPMSFSE
jgi:hypothetical protein